MCPCKECLYWPAHVHLDVYIYQCPSWKYCLSIYIYIYIRYYMCIQILIQILTMFFRSAWFTSKNQSINVFCNTPLHGYLYIVIFSSWGKTKSMYIIYIHVSSGCFAGPGVRGFFFRCWTGLWGDTCSSLPMYGCGHWIPQGDPTSREIKSIWLHDPCRLCVIWWDILLWQLCFLPSLIGFHIYGFVSKLGGSMKGLEIFGIGIPPLKTDPYFLGVVFHLDVYISTCIYIYTYEHVCIYLYVCFMIYACWAFWHIFIAYVSI